MAYQFHNRRKRERNKKIFRMVKLCFFLGLPVLAALIGYDKGKEDAKTESSQHSLKIDELIESRKKLQSDHEKLKAEFEDVSINYKTILDEFQNLNGDAEHKDLLGLIIDLRNKDVSMDRIQHYIQLAGKAQTCFEKGSKRFRIKSPVSSNTDLNVTFSNGDILIYGEGEAFYNADGKPEAWFDESKPVKVTIEKIDDKPQMIEKILPLEHIFFVKGVEHTLKVVKTDSLGIVNASLEVCHF